MDTIGVEPPGKYTIPPLSPTLSQRDAPLPVQVTYFSKNMATLHTSTHTPPVALANLYDQIFLIKPKDNNITPNL